MLGASMLATRPCAPAPASGAGAPVHGSGPQGALAAAQAGCRDTLAATPSGAPETGAARARRVPARGPYVRASSRRRSARVRALPVADVAALGPDALQSIIVGGSVFAAVSVALIKGLTSGDPEMCQACGGAGGVRCFACEGTGKMGGMDADALREKTNSPASLMEANLGETNPRECKACKGSGLLLCAKCNGTGYSKRL